VQWRVEIAFAHQCCGGVDGMQPGKLAPGVTNNKLGAAAPKGSASTRATRPSKYVPRPSIPIGAKLLDLCVVGVMR
jgi:hypothetical protein